MWPINGLCIGCCVIYIHKDEGACMENQKYITLRSLVHCEANAQASLFEQNWRILSNCMWLRKRIWQKDERTVGIKLLKKISECGINGESLMQFHLYSDKKGCSGLPLIKCACLLIRALLNKKRGELPSPKSLHSTCFSSRIATTYSWNVKSRAGSRAHGKPGAR